MSSLLGVAIVAALVSFLTGIVASRVGRRTGFKVPRKLGIHRPPVSTLGGVGFLCGLYVGLLIASYSAQQDRFLTAGEMQFRTCGVGLAILLMFLWGLWLDWRPPKSHRWWLLIGQMLSGAVLFAFGFQIRELSLGTWTFSTRIFSFPLTLLWIAVMINFLRFFDGIDGLFAAVGFAIVLVHLLGIGEMEYYVRVLCAVFGGSLVGLFFVTLYPARVYLGYNGSSLPGICLAALTLASRFKTVTTQTIFVPVAVLLVIAAFGLLLFVESRILIRRGRAQL
jgi:UDP-GlcNAc:undecaprenyl-phosphate GlcNAc-1-phosphate transferase